MTAPKKPAAKNAALKKTAATGTTKRAAATGKVTTPPSPEETVQGEPSSTKTVAPELSTSDDQDSTTRTVPEPEAEVVPEDLPQVAQEDYQAGREAAQRGWHVRVCPHPEGSDQRDVWMRGYHEYAHPQSRSTVVPEDGNTEGGVYGGNR